MLTKIIKNNCQQLDNEFSRVIESLGLEDGCRNEINNAVDRLNMRLKRLKEKSLSYSYYSQSLFCLDRLVYLLKLLAEYYLKFIEKGDKDNAKKVRGYYQKQLSNHSLLKEEIVTYSGDDVEYEYCEYEEIGVAMTKMRAISNYKKILDNSEFNKLNKDPDSNDCETKIEVKYDDELEEVGSDLLSENIQPDNSYDYLDRLELYFNQLKSSCESNLQYLATLTSHSIDTDRQKQLFSNTIKKMLPIWSNMFSDISGLLKLSSGNLNKLLSGRFIYGWLVFKAHLLRLISDTKWGDSTKTRWIQHINRVLYKQEIFVLAQIKTEIKKTDSVCGDRANRMKQLVNDYQDQHSFTQSTNIAKNKPCYFCKLVEELTLWGRRYEKMMLSFLYWQCKDITLKNLKRLGQEINNYNQLSNGILTPFLQNISEVNAVCHTHLKVLTPLKNKLDRDYYELKVLINLALIEKDLKADISIKSIQEHLVSLNQLKAKMVKYANVIPCHIQAKLLHLDIELSIMKITKVLQNDDDLAAIQTAVDKFKHMKRTVNQHSNLIKKPMKLKVLYLDLELSIIKITKALENDDSLLTIQTDLHRFKYIKKTMHKHSNLIEKSMKLKMLKMDIKLSIMEIREALQGDRSIKKIKRYLSYLQTMITELDTNYPLLSDDVIAPLLDFHKLLTLVEEMKSYALRRYYGNKQQTGLISDIKDMHCQKLILLIILEDLLIEGEIRVKNLNYLTQIISYEAKVRQPQLDDDKNKIVGPTAEYKESKLDNNEENSWKLSKELLESLPDRVSKTKMFQGFKGGNAKRFTKRAISVLDPQQENKYQKPEQYWPNYNIRP